MAPVTRKRSKEAKGITSRRQSKSSSTEIPQGQAEASPAPKRKPRAAPKASKANRKTRRCEEATEEEHEGSSTFPTAIQYLTKGLKNSGGLKTEMRVKADGLVEAMEKQVRKESPQLIKYLPADVASFLLHTDASNTTHVGDAQNSTYKKGQACLASLKALVQEYEALNRGGNNIKKPARVHWEQDSKDLRALNNKARGIAFQALNSIVMPQAKGGDVEHQAKGGGDDIETMASELLAEAKPQRDEDTWGTVTHGLLKAFSGAVGLLPKADGS